MTALDPGTPIVRPGSQCRGRRSDGGNRKARESVQGPLSDGGNRKARESVQRPLSGGGKHSTAPGENGWDKCRAPLPSVLVNGGSSGSSLRLASGTQSP